MTRECCAYSLRIFYGQTSTPNIESQQGNQLGNITIKAIRSFGSVKDKHFFAMLLLCPRNLRFHEIKVPNCHVLGEQVVNFSSLPPLTLDGQIVDIAFLHKNLRKRRMKIPNALKKRFRKEKHRTLTEQNWKRFVKVSRLKKLGMAT